MTKMKWIRNLTEQPAKVLLGLQPAEAEGDAGARAEHWLRRQATQGDFYAAFSNSPQFLVTYISTASSI